MDVINKSDNIGENMGEKYPYSLLGIQINSDAAEITWEIS